MLLAAEKAQRVLQVLEGWYGAATTELRYRNPYELAVAVVLLAEVGRSIRRGSLGNHPPCAGCKRSC